jgi:hypothetical protein
LSILSIIALCCSKFYFIERYGSLARNSKPNILIVVGVEVEEQYLAIEILHSLHVKLQPKGHHLAKLLIVEF